MTRTTMTGMETMNESDGDSADEIDEPAETDK